MNGSRYDRGNSSNSQYPPVNDPYSQGSNHGNVQSRYGERDHGDRYPAEQSSGAYGGNDGSYYSNNPTDKHSNYDYEHSSDASWSTRPSRSNYSSIQSNHDHGSQFCPTNDSHNFHGGNARAREFQGNSTRLSSDISNLLRKSNTSIESPNYDNIGTGLNDNNLIATQGYANPYNYSPSEATASSYSSEPWQHNENLSKRPERGGSYLTENRAAPVNHRSDDSKESLQNQVRALKRQLESQKEQIALQAKRIREYEEKDQENGGGQRQATGNSWLADETPGCSRLIAQTEPTSHNISRNVPTGNNSIGIGNKPLLAAMGTKVMSQSSVCTRMNIPSLLGANVNMTTQITSNIVTKGPAVMPPTSSQHTPFRTQGIARFNSPRNMGIGVIRGPVQSAVAVQRVAIRPIVGSTKSGPVLIARCPVRPSYSTTVSSSTEMNTAKKSDLEPKTSTSLSEQDKEIPNQNSTAKHAISVAKETACTKANVTVPEVSAAKNFNQTVSKPLASTQSTSPTTTSYAKVSVTTTSSVSSVAHSSPSVTSVTSNRVTSASVMSNRVTNLTPQANTASIPSLLAMQQASMLRSRLPASSGNALLSLGSLLGQPVMQDAMRINPFMRQFFYPRPPF